jgi:hypothetical protein
MLLLLSDWGCSKPVDVDEIPFVEEASLKEAYETLVFLEASEETKKNRYVPTELGLDVAKLVSYISGGE